MINSSERINYITNYLTSYKLKIESLNSNGLFDNAVLYELFAQEICSLWFGIKFYNLNVEKSNFPCVDLVSEDKSIYVQVSTAQDIPSKIKNTLEKIRDSQNNNFSSINNFYVFVLGNNSIEKIENYVGNKRIGNIDFTVANNLITLDKIINKAKTDLVFQKQLYELLDYESKNFSKVEHDFREAIQLNKVLFHNNINDLINNEYEIDRTDIIEAIKKDNNKFISIIGEAGIGKSALCKKLLANEQLILYTRAEKITQINNINEIWETNINDVLRYLNGKRIVFFIDALEFIADSSNTKKDVLQQLFEVIKQYNNAYLVVSCRSCDKNAFISLFNNYQVKTYILNPLDYNQIKRIANKYQVIDTLLSKQRYSQLLKFPFYINLIISKIKDIDSIKDINNLREYIWSDIICLKNKKLPQNITYSSICNAVNEMVFTRAKNFDIGVLEESIDKNIISLLSSEEVISKFDKDKIRLKYDIFEDICFERFIDRKFDECKGDYNTFFSSLENLGRCIYRRYQIWVENKLLDKENREKFLFTIISTDKIPEEWNRNTLIGIIKSNFCSDFFNEYEDYIIDNKIERLIEIINLFAFEPNIIELKYGLKYTILTPVGLGRKLIIKIVFDHELYKKLSLKSGILKLCLDYSKYTKFEDNTAIAVCNILEFYLNELIDYLEKNESYNIDETYKYLTALFLLAEYSKEWLSSFFKKVIDDYLKGNSYKSISAENLIRFVLKNTNQNLVKYLTNDLCCLAYTYWFEYSARDKESPFGFDYSLTTYKSYGFSKRIESYDFDFKTIFDNTFYFSLVNNDFFVALEWAIKVTNHIALTLKEKDSNSTSFIKLIINENQETKNYICNPDFWMIGLQDNHINDLLGDIIYILSCYSINTINSLPKEQAENFAYRLKSIVFEQSNNIIMLTLIRNIGYSCKNKLSGYAVELASSIEIVKLDFEKMSLFFPNDSLELLNKQISLSLGVPSFPNRYSWNKKRFCLLRDYIFETQFNSSKNIRNRIIIILEYLYKNVEDTKENDLSSLLIQTMDARNAKISNGKNYINFETLTHGFAKELVDNSKENKFNKEQEEFQNIISICNNKISNKIFTIEAQIEAIDSIITLIEKSDLPCQMESQAIKLIASVLLDKSLDYKKRSEYCSFWIKGIIKLLNNESFIFDYGYSYILFQQIEYQLEANILNKLKILILGFLLYKEDNGIYNNIILYLKEYLRTNTKIARNIFITIAALAEDKMKHYLFNEEYIKKHINSKYKYIPNKTKPPIWVDDEIIKSGDVLFQSREDEIIKTYLINNENFDISEWKIENCDIVTLSSVADCGLSLDDKDFYLVMNSLTLTMFNLIYDNNPNDYLYFIKNEMSDFYKNEFAYKTDIEPALNILFNNIEEYKFDYKVIRFYLNLTTSILSVFFDSYNNSKARKICKDNIKKIESRINRLSNSRLKESLSAMIFLSLDEFHAIDWNELNTSYSYNDKIFLNELWSKYGKYHFSSFLQVVYQLRINELLPELLLPLNDILTSLNKEEKNLKKLLESKENKTNLNLIISLAYFHYNEQIKQNNDLVKAYENILQILINYRYEEAVVLLDQFLIH